MCWCVDVLMWRCVDVLMCWCVDVLMCWCVDVLMCWCVDVLMCWCVDDCVDVCCVLTCWCVLICADMNIVEIISSNFRFFWCKICSCKLCESLFPGKWLRLNCSCVTPPNIHTNSLSFFFQTCVLIILLICWYVDMICWCVDVLMCWCVDALMCWYVDMLMCW